MDAKRHILILVGLIGLSGLVQTVVIGRAEVPGLDAIRFVDIAGRIDRDGLLDTIRHEREQPLFPAAIRAVHEVFERSIGSFPTSWVLAAQVAAAGALVLAVVPIYLLSVRLFGREAALVGSVLFCVLPEVSRLGADGLGDSTHLLFFAVAFWAAVRYFGDRACRRRPIWLLVAGASTGLAMLARAESLILLVAVGVVLAAFQFSAERRQPWSKFGTASIALAVGFGLVMIPYLAASGTFAPRDALARTLGRYDPPELSTSTDATGPTIWQVEEGRPMSFAAKEPSVSLRRRGYAAAGAKFLEELADVFGYWVAGFALWGLWRKRGQLSGDVDRFAQTFFLLFAALAIHFAAAEGYLSARHLLPLLIAGIGSVGFGLTEIARALEAPARSNRKTVGWHWRLASVCVSTLARRQWHPTETSTSPSSLQPTAYSLWTPILLVLVVVACLVQSVQPVNANQRAHRRAAEWLLDQAEVSGTVLDTRGWTGLYSGRPTYRYRDGPTALSSKDLAFVVLERRELVFESERGRTLRHLLDVAARPVASFAPQSMKEQDPRTVLVYRWQPERFDGSSENIPREGN